MRRCTPGVNTHVGRIIVGYHDINGYRCVLLQRDAGRSTQKVHRLVVEAFIGQIPDGMQVNHKNGVRNDNRACNLEIATPTENTLHSFRVLKRPVSRHQRAQGERHGNSKLNADAVREIRRLYAQGIKQTDLAKRFSLNQTTVSGIVRRTSWRHVS